MGDYDCESVSIANVVCNMTEEKLILFCRRICIQIHNSPREGYVFHGPGNSGRDAPLFLSTSNFYDFLYQKRLG